MHGDRAEREAITRKRLSASSPELLLENGTFTGSQVPALVVMRG